MTGPRTPIGARAGRPDDEFAIAMAECYRRRMPVSLLSVGIDHFDNVARLLGNARTQHLKHKVITVIRDAAPEATLRSPAKGSSVFMLMQTSGQRKAVLTAHDLCRRVEFNLEPIGDSWVAVTCSVGVVHTSWIYGMERESLLTLSGTARRLAAQAGGNRVVVCAHGNSQPSCGRWWSIA